MVATRVHAAGGGAAAGEEGSGSGPGSEAAPAAVAIGNHTWITNDTAAAAAGLPPGSVVVGARCTVLVGVVAGAARLTLVTHAKSNLDIGTDYAVDPLPAALAEAAATPPAEVEARNTAYWAAYWAKASVSLPQHPGIERFWCVEKSGTMTPVRACACERVCVCVCVCVVTFLDLLGSPHVRYTPWEGPCTLLHSQ